MKNFLLLLSIFMLFASCTMQQNTQTQEEVEQAILALERQALDQWAAGNPIGFSESFAEDVTYFDDIGAHMRMVGLEAMKTYLASLDGQIPPHEYEIVDPNVQIYGDIAIRTLRYRDIGESFSVKRYHIPDKFTSIFNQVSHQVPASYFSCTPGMHSVLCRSDG